MLAPRSPNSNLGGLNLPNINPPNSTPLPNPTLTNNTNEVTAVEFIGLDALSSPIGDRDLGIPESPRERDIVPVDHALYDEGYDSDGLRPPTEFNNLIELEVKDVEEEALPDEIVPSIPVNGPE